MNLESLQEMKYKELQKMALRFQIELPQSKKKDALIQLLLEYLEKNPQTEAEQENKENEDTSKKKVKKVKKIVKKSKNIENEGENEEAEIVPKTTTRSRANANQTINKIVQLQDENKKESNKVEQPEDEYIIETKYEIRADGKKVKKIKKIKKKVVKEQQEDKNESEKPIEDVKPIRKTNKKSEKQMQENEEEVKSTEKKTKKKSQKQNVDQNKEEEIVEKKAKKVKAKKNNNHEQVIEPKTPKSTRSTRARKSIRDLDINEPNLVQNKEQAEIHVESNPEPVQSETETQVQNKTLEIEQVQENTALIQEERHFNQQQHDLSDDQVDQNDFKLALEEDTNDEKKLNEETAAVELEPIDSSLMTNDEEKSLSECEKNENPEITRDILNTTFDKQEDGFACGTFYSNKQEETRAEEPQNEQNKTSDEEASKPKTAGGGGARIVRPKQTVTVLQAVKTTKNETVVEEIKKVVEVVNREAGPRIVKPMTASEEIQVEPKRKINIEQNKQVKKVKENEMNKPIVPRKVPDFKAIHEKESQKMESIDSYANRKQERFNKLSEKSPIVTSEKTSKLKTPTIVSKIQNAVKPKTPGGPSTPKLIKNFAGNLLSNIPKIIKRDEKQHEEPQQQQNDEQKPVDPKTPEVTANKNSKLLKTPSSVTKPTESFLLKSNLKRNPSVKDSNVPPQLQTSSFVRRKSFDLNASLARQLNYKPHVGHLKKVDFSAKSVFLASLATTNLNETKCADKTVLKQNDSIVNADANSRRISMISKVRSESAGADRNTLTDYIKSDKLKQITDKSTMMAKKLRMEKAKIFKQTKSDQNRQLENCENEEA